MRKRQRESKINRFFQRPRGGRCGGIFFGGPSWVPLVPNGSCSSLSGPPRAFLWARLGRFGPSAESCFSYKDLKHFRLYGCSHGSLGLFRAVLDPSRWPKGSVGRPSFARTWYRVFSFFCIHRIFSTTSFFQPPGGVKGGSWSNFETFLGPT